MTIQIFIVRSRPSKKHRVTIVAEVNFKEGYLEYNYAICNPHDHFNKRNGVAIAKGRLKKAPIIQLIKSKTTEDIMKVMYYLLDHTERLYERRLYEQKRW